MRPSRQASVHPQASGERRLTPTYALTAHGSPPGVWGKGHDEQTKVSEVRFTPRRLGKGSSSPILTSTRAVHPQASGERAWGAPTASCTETARGSPPGVWGKARSVLASSTDAVARFTPRRLGKGASTVLSAGSALARFTPRRLGKGRAASAWSALLPVHPQASGERVKRLDERFGGGRFTPRRLGKGSAATAFSGTRSGSVHPQASGERLIGAFVANGCKLPGSPPGVWGKGPRWPVTALARSLRFTPRRLGKGRPAGSRTRRRPVHPQASGERLGSHGPSGAFLGSPPGVWGKVIGSSLPTCKCRFTPRRLGKGRWL